MATEAEKNLPTNIKEKLEQERLLNFEQQQNQLKILSTNAEKEMEAQINL